MEMIINFLKRYELTLISFTIIIMGVLKHFDITLIFENEFLNFLFLLSVVHILYIYIPKFSNCIKLLNTKIKESKFFDESIKRIEQLPEGQTKILNILYLNDEDKFHSYTKEIKSLIDNKFIIFVQNIEGTLNLYKLNKKVYKYLDDKNITQIKDYLTTLSDNEKYVLNQFYDNSQKNYYEAEFSQVVETLINKRIIERKDEKMIVISKYAKDLLQYYNKEQIKHTEIELGKYNIYARIHSGGGATGSYRY